METVTLRARSGTTTAAGAVVSRPTTVGRWGRGVAFAVGGLVLGAASIFIPVVHFVSTWAIPLAGIVAAVVSVRSRGRIVAIEGACPSCGATTRAEKITVETPMWLRCTACNEPAEIRLVAP